MNTNYKSIILAIGLFLVVSTSVSAAPGDLDLTFGSGGTVTTFFINKISLDSANGMAIQSDGKIVVVCQGYSGNSSVFAVIRYNTNGSLDTSFGDNGIVRTPNGNPTSIAIQADGKIVVSGYTYPGFAIVRYNSNGTLDTSFNSTGIVNFSFGNSDEGINSSVAIQADGKIVVAGSSENSFAVVRFNPNGSLDTSFNGTGKVLTPVGGIETRANEVAIQADGKIVVAGNGGNFTLVRYNPNGSLDSTFNGTGIVTTSVGDSNSGASSVAIQADGKIVAVGSGNNGSNTNFAVVRYNPNGSLDTSFGGTGKIVIPVGDSNSGASSVAIQADGKIVAAGGMVGTIVASGAIVRFNPNGSLDTTFNGTGIVLGPIDGFLIGCFAIQTDGKIVTAGGLYDTTHITALNLARYQGGSNANIRTRFDFDGDGKADVSVFRPSDRIWYLNRSTQGFSATQFGLSSDKITPADFDGDGKTDIAVYRDGIWYWLNSSNGNFNAFQFGLAGDIPVPADFTGDGRAELAVYRSGIWFTWNLATNQFNAVQFGIATDKPVVGDYDGDGRADFAVYRDGLWYLLQSTQGFTAIQFGIATDKLVPADYDGDGKTDIAVYRDGIWHLLKSSQGYTAFQFGLATDVPTPADYDGDGKADAAVYREGIWYLLQSTSGISIQNFGLANDKPVPAVFLP